jgi:predicted nucleotidyltransferase component of viral defense system
MEDVLINLRQLTSIARKELGYPLHVAEKDYFLALALKTIYLSELKDRLVFKGGTALHHHHLPQYRFSEDLDFISTDQNVSVEDVRNVFVGSAYFTIKKDYTSHLTVKIEKLEYVGILAQPSFIKIDISNVKNITLPPRISSYTNVWGINVKAKVLDILEICAEKLSATSGRIRYRDFYDLFLIVTELGVSISDAVELLYKKDLENNVNPNLIFKNWLIAKKDKSDDLATILLKKEVGDADIEAFIRKLRFKEIPANHVFLDQKQT